LAATEQRGVEPVKKMTRPSRDSQAFLFDGEPWQLIATVKRDREEQNSE
jgi:hypothetical protein